MKRQASVPPRDSNTESWSPKGLKGYPHFDPPISKAAAIAVATDPEKVRRNSFFPFMLFEEVYQPFRDLAGKPDKKVRPIRYGARRDAYIFEYYRSILSALYEKELAARGLGNCVLAYRRIPQGQERGGKCNIHHAKDAFNEIAKRGDCVAMALDIKSYFDCICHARLKAAWMRLLGLSELPPDHFQVFKAITRYSFAYRNQVYERLGLYGDKVLKSGRKVKGYLVPRDEMPTRLCDAATFRSKLCGGDGLPSLLYRNDGDCGIPQGAPLSDLLANLALTDFDDAWRRRVEALGGSYRRYSDDILIILPQPLAVATKVVTDLSSDLPFYGAKLKLKEKKTIIVSFTRLGDQLTAKTIAPTIGAAKGLEYLGFRFDGQRVYFRDSTLSRLHRKIALSARREASQLAKRYPNRDAAQLEAIFPFEAFSKRFGRIEKAGSGPVHYRDRTFWSYAKQAIGVFGKDGVSLRRQLRRQPERVKHRVKLELQRAVARRA